MMSGNDKKVLTQTILKNYCIYIYIHITHLKKKYEKDKNAKSYENTERIFCLT